MKRVSKTRQTTLVLASSILVYLAPAVTQAMEYRGLAKIGFDTGGDSLVNVPSLSSSSTQKIRANEGGVVNVGVSIQNNAGTFAVEPTIGWKSTKQEGRIQDYEFVRYPLDVLAFYNFAIGDTGKSQFRIGFGPTYHIKTKLLENGRLGDFKTNFDDALGFVAQIDGIIAFQGGRSGINLGLRYTNVNYEATGIPTLRARGIGFFVGGRFPIGL